MNTMSNNPLNIYKSDHDSFSELLLDELTNTTDFKSSIKGSNINTPTASKQLINQIFNTLDTSSISDISNKAIQPVLTLWHSLLKSFIKKGFSTKDTAMLIFSLKSSLQRLKEKDTPIKQEIQEQFEKVLDLLGILTFEMYSIENEKVISLQSEQIQYLQTKESQFSKQLIGSSPAMNALYKAIGLILDNDLTVLLEGESGTGKDLIATTIHNNSKRVSKPFVAINCGAIPKELIESELFGHEKGAFTGAQDKRIGKFELANGGTLFLDEVAELPLDLQVKLLRILQNKQLERVGGEKQIKIDVRIIAATNKNLKEAVNEKKFRLDLYYRLKIFQIQIPSLRERKEDIEALSLFFIEKYAKELNITPPSITKDAITYLQNQRWEGNIRELENLIQRSLVLSQGSQITSSILSIIPGQYLPSLSTQQQEKTTPKNLPTPTKENTEILSLDDVEKNAIQNALNQKKWNMSQVAKALKISRTTLYSKIQKYNIQEP